MDGDALVDAVGAILNIGDPNADTVPTSDDIVLWLNLAQGMIARNVPADDLQPLFDTVTAKDLGTGVLRVISVDIDAGVPAKWVPHDEFLRMSAVATADTDKAVWSYIKSITAGQLAIATVPTGSAWSVVVMKEPVDLDDTAARDDVTVPAIYDQTLILYAVAMAKIQDEEMPDAQYLLQVLGSVLGRGNLPDEALRQKGGK